MATPPPSAAALVTELASLINLPREQRSRQAAERLDEIRWAVGGIDPADRMTAYATAVAATDPDHLLGPYPDPLAKLTHELYAFEAWRVSELYFYSSKPRADAARRLLAAIEPITLTFSHEERYEYAEVRTMLDNGEITETLFPNFSLRAYLLENGADLRAHQAAIAAQTNAWTAAAAKATTGPEPTRR